MTLATQAAGNSPKSGGVGRYSPGPSPKVSGYSAPRPSPSRAASIAAAAASPTAIPASLAAPSGTVASEVSRSACEVGRLVGERPGEHVMGGRGRRGHLAMRVGSASRPRGRAGTCRRWSSRRRTSRRGPWPCTGSSPQARYRPCRPPRGCSRSSRGSPGPTHHRTGVSSPWAATTEANPRTRSVTAESTRAGRHVRFICAPSFSPEGDGQAPLSNASQPGRGTMCPPPGNVNH